jgi:hypothetical protein
MADDFDNDMTGALFTNDRKENDKQPDYNGSCEVEGKQYWVAGWKKKIKNGDRAGQTFMSLAFKPKDQDSNKSSRGNARSGGRGRDEAPARGRGSSRRDDDDDFS